MFDKKTSRYLSITPPAQASEATRSESSGEAAIVPGLVKCHDRKLLAFSI